MAAFDWVVVAVLVFSLALGAWRGLVYEVLSVLNWLAAFVLAQWLGPALGAWLPMSGWDDSLRGAAGFIIVFIGALFAGGLLAWLTKKLIEAVGLRPVDRALGALFGLVRGIVLVLALAVVVHLTGSTQAEWWTQSQSSGVATAALRGLKPALPEPFGKYLPD